MNTEYCENVQRRAEIYAAALREIADPSTQPFNYAAAQRVAHRALEQAKQFS